MFHWDQFACCLGIILAIGNVFARRKYNDIEMIQMIRTVITTDKGRFRSAQLNDQIDDQGPLLLTLFNLNPDMDEWL